MKKKTSFSRLVAGLTAFLLVLAPMPFGEMGISNGIGITASAEESSTSDSTGENGSGEGKTPDSGEENSSEEGETSGGGEENGSDEGEKPAGEGENNSGNSDEPADEDSSDDSEQPSDEDEDSSDDAEVKEIWISGDELDIPDSDDLFSEYVDRTFYDDTDISTFANPNYGRQSLTNAMDREVYDLLKEEITKIANGTRSNTQITLNLNQSWTTLDNSWSQVVHALLVDLPYDFYWFDKTTSYGISGYYNAPKFSFPVAKAYAGSGPYTADTKKTSAASNAAANAKAIVDKYSGASDYSKLCGYFSTICDLVEYDHDAVDNNRDYGDPWQIIYAFDGDPTTNIVCEGYSKAFKYLCDLSTFKNSSIESALVTGIAGGRHMWNIVSIDDVSYFVDVTNCDKGAPGYNDCYGYPDYLFLKGVRNPTATGFTAVGGYNSTLKYTYDQETTEMYSSEFLTVSTKDYVSSDIKCTVNIEDDALALIVNGKLADSSSVTVNAGDKLEVYVRIKDFINKAVNYSCTGAQVSTELYYSDDSTGFIDKLTLSDFDENGAELTIELVDSEWDDEILSGLIKLDVGEGVNVYPYSYSENKPVYDDPLTSGDYYPGGQKVCITADSSALSGKFISVNGTQAVGKVNNSGVYQIDDFYLSGINGVAKISIADKGYKFNAYNGVIGYVNGRAIENGTYVENGKVIELEAIIDNYINRKLTINGTTVAPKLDNVYHRYFIYEYTVNGTDVNAELVEEKWSDDELSKYVKLEIDDGIMVFSVDGDSEYDADQDVEEDAVLENGEYFTKGYYIEIYSRGDYAKGRNILINNKVYKLNLDRNGNYYLRYLVNCQEDTLTIEFESAVTAQVGNSRLGFDTLDEALAYIKKNGSSKDVTVILNKEMTITKLAVPSNVFSFRLENKNGVKINFNMSALAIPVDTTLNISGDGENLKPIAISVAAGKTLNYDSFTHYGGAVTVKGTNTSVLNINSYLTIGGISTFSEVNVADGVAVSVEGNVTGVKLFNGALWLKDPKYTATITTFGKGTVRLYDHDGKNAKVTISDVAESLNVELVDPETTSETVVESGRTILWAGSAKNFTDKVTVSNKTSSKQTLNAYLYGKEIKAEYGEAVTVIVDERSKGYPNLELALKAITDKDKDYEIILNDDITVSKLTLPKTANSIVFNGSGSLKLNMTALAIPVNTSFFADIVGTNARPLAITVAAGKTLEIGCGTANIGAVKGANTSALYVNKSNTFDSVASFGKVTVGNKAVLTVKGNVTAVKLLQGTIAFPNAKSTATITTAEDSAVILTDNNGTAAKVTVSDVIGTLTVKFVDSDNKVISLQSGRSILIAGGKTDFTDKITVENASTSSKTLNAFLYGKDIRAEYAGAITLSDGTDTKNYPNLDLAVKAVNDVSKDYTLTLNENITVSKLTLPKTAKSITFDGSSVLNLNMTALTLPVNTKFRTELVGKNAKPLAITVAAGKTLDLSTALNIGAIKGSKTSVLNINNYATIGGISTFGEVNVADKVAVSVEGNVTAVTHFNGALWLKNPKYTANITNFGTGEVVLYDIGGKIAKVTVGNVDANGKLKVKITDNLFNTLDLAGGRTLLYAGGKTDFTDRITIENTSTTGKQLTAFLYGKEIRAEYAEAITLYNDEIEIGNYPNLDLAFKEIGNSKGDYTVTLNDGIAVSKLTLPKNADSIIFDGKGSLDLNMTALSIPTNTVFSVPVNGTNAKPLAITVAAGKKLVFDENGFVSNIGAVKGGRNSNFFNYETNTVGSVSSFKQLEANELLTVTGNVSGVTFLNGTVALPNAKSTLTASYFYGDATIGLVDNDGSFAKITFTDAYDENSSLRISVIGTSIDDYLNGENDDDYAIPSGKTVLYTNGKYDFTDSVGILNESTAGNALTPVLYGKEIKAVNTAAVTLTANGANVGNFATLEEAFAKMTENKNYVININDDICVSKFVLPTRAASIKIKGTDNTLWLTNVSAITANCDFTIEGITFKNTKAFTLTAKKDLTLKNVTSDCLSAVKGNAKFTYIGEGNNLTFTGKNGTEPTKITGFINTAKK